MPVPAGSKLWIDEKYVTTLAIVMTLRHIFTFISDTFLFLYEANLGIVCILHHFFAKIVNKGLAFKKPPKKELLGY